MRGNVTTGAHQCLCVVWKVQNKYKRKDCFDSQLWDEYRIWGWESREPLCRALLGHNRNLPSQQSLPPSYADQMFSFVCNLMIIIPCVGATECGISASEWPTINEVLRPERETQQRFLRFIRTAKPCSDAEGKADYLSKLGSGAAATNTTQRQGEWIHSKRSGVQCYVFVCS